MEGMLNALVGVEYQLPMLGKGTPARFGLSMASTQLILLPKHLSRLKYGAPKSALGGPSATDTRQRDEGWDRLLKIFAGLSPEASQPW